MNKTCNLVQKLSSRPTYKAFSTALISEAAVIVTLGFIHVQIFSKVFYHFDSM